MTDTAPAYAQALDQLRAERDAAVARADAAERQWAAIAQTPDGGWHFAHERAAAQLAEVTVERDLALAFMGLVGRVYERPRGSGETIDQWGGRLTTAIYDDAEVNLTAKAIPTPRTPTELEEHTGPVAFERNQLRDENVRLRDEVATLTAELDGTRARLTMTTRDLDAAERTVAALKTVAHAIVNAVAKGAP